jgi:TolB-like protein/class 3 adenylate cyclase/Flp pilus assembly protein TadD
MADTKRRLAAIMFTDMVGYSALAHSDEELSSEILEDHQSIVRPVIGKHEGVEVKTTGDGFLVEFSHPLSAVRCAIELQGSLQTHNSIAKTGRQIHIRIGIHWGEVEEIRGDIYGDGVNIASRIEGVAETDGICLSDAVYTQVRDKIQMPMVTIGTPELKNINTPIEIYKIGLPRLEKEVEVQVQEDIERSEASIAVLPFENMSADPDNEYFSDGITEELLNALARVPDLRVISRTSVFNLKGKDISIAEVGEQLNVENVVEGSVRKHGNAVRITAQLIHVNSDSHIWSETYDRELENIFQLQEELAGTIANKITGDLSQDAKNQMLHQPTANVEAYELYLRGRSFQESTSNPKEDWKTALDFYLRAIHLDDSFALAYVGLSQIYNDLADKEQMDRELGMAKSVEAGEKALELDDTLAESHVVVASHKLQRNFDWNGAEFHYQKALKLNPGYAQAHSGYAWYLAYLGQFDEAMIEARKAAELSPISGMIFMPANFGYLARRYQESIAICKRALALNFNMDWAYVILAFNYIGLGEYELALEEANKTTFYGGLAKSVKVLALGHLGQKERATRELAVLIKEHGDYVMYQISGVYMQMGEFDKGFEWLEKAYEHRDAILNMIIDPLMDPVRDDPRFVEMLSRVGPAK